MFLHFRVLFIRDYTIKTLRIKPDKWVKLCNSDEQKYFLAEFIAAGKKQELVISQNIGGHLQVGVMTYDYIANKYRHVYAKFVREEFNKKIAKFWTSAKLVLVPSG